MTGRKMRSAAIDHDADASPRLIFTLLAIKRPRFIHFLCYLMLLVQISVPLRWLHQLPGSLLSSVGKGRKVCVREFKQLTCR